MIKTALQTVLVINIDSFFGRREAECVIKAGGCKFSYPPAIVPMIFNDLLHLRSVRINECFKQFRKSVSQSMNAILTALFDLHFK